MDFLTEQRLFAQRLSQVMMRTLLYTPDKIERTLRFQQLFLLLKRKCLNINGGKNITFWIPKSEQQLFPNYEDDLWNLWNFFVSNVSEQQFLDVATSLFNRTILGENLELWVDIVLNNNSKYIFKDTNLSISLVDKKTGIEVWLIGFFILSDGIIEIFQLQCKKKYGANGMYFKLLVEELKKYVTALWFRKVYIIKSEKLFITNTPTVLPTAIQNEDQLWVWMERHRLHMKLTYDVNPIRKWGFHKPTDSRMSETYSWEMSLE